MPLQREVFHQEQQADSISAKRLHPSTPPFATLPLVHAPPNHTHTFPFSSPLIQRISPFLPLRALH